MVSASCTMIERHHGNGVRVAGSAGDFRIPQNRPQRTPSNLLPPIVRVEQHEEGKALCFTARVQIRPARSFGDYRAVAAAARGPAPAAQSTASPRRTASQDARLSAPLRPGGPHRRRQPVEVPETIIHERALSMARSLEQRLKQDQSSMVRILQSLPYRPGAFAGGLCPGSGRFSCARLTLLAIARAEGLDATEAEDDAEAARLSGMIDAQEQAAPAAGTPGEGYQNPAGYRHFQSCRLGRCPSPAANGGNFLKQKKQRPGASILHGPFCQDRGPKALRFSLQNPDDFFFHIHPADGVFRMNHRYRKRSPSVGSGVRSA